VDSPRESSSEALCQRGVPGFFLSQGMTMKGAGAGLLTRQECRSHLDGLCAKNQGGDYAARIRDATGGDHGHIDHVG
jgi:hypothetical protein